MNLPTRRRSLAARIAAAGAFADQSAEGDDGTLEIAIPEDLSALSDAELAELSSEVLTAFNDLKSAATENGPTDEDIATLSQLRDALTVLNGESTQRAEKANARAKALAELDGEVNGSPAAESDDVPVDAGAPVRDEVPVPVAAAADAGTMAGAMPGGDAAPGGHAVPAAAVTKAAGAIAAEANTLMDAAKGGSPAPAPAVAAASTGQMASKKVMPKTINVGNLSARTNGGRVVRKAEGNPVDGKPLFTASRHAGDFALGSSMSMDEVAAAFEDSMGGASNAAVRAALREGGHFSQRYPIAKLHKPMAPELAVSGTGDFAEFNPEHPAYKFATDQSRLPGQSLVAAGGWCAPSETVYDMVVLESTDGLISLPEVNVARGGLRFTTGPDWTDIYDSTGFCFTEADDIAGIYNGNEVQSITEGGSGLTSFTLTFNGQTTVSIPASATPGQIRNALESLSTVLPNNVNVTGPAGASTGPWNVVFVNALGDQNVPQMTATPTGGSGTVTIATVTGGDSVVSGKPCNTIGCPAFVDVRLNVCGVCITGANLQNTAYPELTRRYLSGALAAHAHRLNTQITASMITQSTPLTWAGNVAVGNGLNAAAATLLASIEYNVEDLRYKRRMARGATMEAVFPFWIHGVIRADISWRLGIANPFEVTDAMINGWFASRGINAQFVYDWQNLGAGTPALKWPTSVQYLLYPAGTFVKGTQDIISLEMLHDSTLNATNNFTAIFTEEAWSVMKMGLESRVITVGVCPGGGVNAGGLTVCA